MASPSIYCSQAAETWSLVLNIKGQSTYVVGQYNSSILYGFIVENLSGSTAYVQVFDGYVQPTTGTASLFCNIPVPGLAGSNVTSFGGNGLEDINFHCKSGIVVALSSTRYTYTPITNGQAITAFFT
jgi:hypothetical protein